ncbi:hypothetical protein GPALN_011346 [Globodera pallida]|nr:hypothetical protein GPALN_011346 [Globodera pallida]
MEPQEIEPHLLNNALRQLIYFTGLDLSTNPQHSAIFNAFVNKTGERSSTAVHYKMLTAGSELFTSCSRSMSSSVDSGARASSPLFTSAELSGSTALPARSGVMAMVKRRWPLKYLEDRPALIVNFVDLDWDHTAWLEKRAECESKINALRQSIGQRETKLALVLIQRQKAASMDEPMANEKALELCQHCRLNSRLLFVFPRLSDERALKERVNRLEKAFHGIAQEFYQACFKRIRSRSVPNNDAHLLVRQQFKLAFISELREDRHSALRYYKQAYQIGHELDVSDVDVYEHCSVASLLNYKICELNFVLNSAVEAINQFRRHHNIFFKREPTFYPSRELAAIELAWWKAQQCRLFAELFNRAVSNGLAAYPSQNPGRFLGEAATHHKRANAMIRALKAKLATTAPQRQTSQLAGDPLQSFDLSTPTTFYGQRPWRMQPFLANSAVAKAQKLPPLSSVNQQLLEHGAKLFLENNVHENYAQSLQLLSAAVAQFKRYGCERFANLWLFDMAEEYIEAQQFAKALQILRRLCVEDKNVTFYPFLRETLVAVANAAFCALSLNEWAGALFQLLHRQLANSSIRSYPVAPLSSANENHQGRWMENFGNFLSGENCVPFPLLSSANAHNSLVSSEELNSLRHQWHQLLDHQQKAQFQLDMGDLSHSPVQFCAHFLVVGVADALQSKLDDADNFSSFFGDADSDTKIASAGDPILIEVVLQNISHLPLQFERCSLVLEEISQTSDAKIAKTLSDWITADNSSKNSAFSLFPGRPLRVFFVYKTSLALSLQQLTQMSSTALNRSQSPLSESPRELLLAIRHFSLRSPSGSLNWNIDHGSVDQHHRLAKNRWMRNMSDRLDKNCLANNSSATGMVLFVDESVELPFTLQNGEHNTGTVLKDIWVTCHKVCREDEELTNHKQQQQQRLQHPSTNAASPNFVVQRTFAVATSTRRTQQQLQQQQQQSPINGEKDSRTTATLLVPAFSQEIATLLAPEQSTDFSIRLQSRSNNCIALRVQVYCTIPAAAAAAAEREAQPLEEPAEWVQHFPIRCVEPFEPKITVYCENGEKAQCLVFGQQFRVQLQLKCNGRVTAHNVHWKLNDPFERPVVKPLASSIEEHLEKLKISPADPHEFSNTHSTWMKVTNVDGQPRVKETAEQSNGDEEQQRIQLGDVVVEWSSDCSFEHVRSVLALPTMPPILTIPITIDVGIHQRFRLRYCLRNTFGGPLAVHLCFEQPDGIFMEGIGENSFLFFPNDEHIAEQCVVPVTLGLVNFPRPTISCVSSIPDRADLEFGAEELEQLNHLITTHTFNSMPKHFFILP